MGRVKRSSGRCGRRQGLYMHYDRQKQVRFVEISLPVQQLEWIHEPLEAAARRYPYLSHGHVRGIHKHSGNNMMLIHRLILCKPT
jgi:hypothetical protein